MEAARRVAKNTGILYARMGITLFISLYATRLTLSALGTEDFGLFNLVGGVIAMLGFLNNSMATATQRFMSFAQGEGKGDKVKSIFNMSVILHIGTALLVLLILELAGHFFFTGILNIEASRLETAQLIYQFTVISTIFTIVSVPYEAVITAHENMLFYAVLGIVEAILKLAIAFYITDCEFDHLLAFGFLMAALSIFLLIFRMIYCRFRYAECKLAIRKSFNKSLLQQMAEFAGWSFFGAATSMISNYGQGLVINVFFGTALNAAQGVANQVSGQLGALAGTMLRALNPMLVKSEGAGNRSLMLKASMMGSKVGFFLLMILYVPAIVEMPYIFKLWLVNPPEYAVEFCRLLLLRDLLGQIFVTLTSSIYAVGGIKRFQIFSSALTMLPLTISAVYFYFGYSALSLYWIYLLYTPLWAMVILYFAKVNCSLSVIEFLRSVFSRCLLAFNVSMGFAILPLFWLDSGLTRLISVCAISMLTSLLVIWLIGLTGKERRQIIEVLRFKKNTPVSEL
jgi:O-antigen/teichoic acid export membrane protein